jgi:hypothetical protein
VVQNPIEIEAKIKVAGAGGSVILQTLFVPAGFALRDRKVPNGLKI